MKGKIFSNQRLRGIFSAGRSGSTICLSEICNYLSWSKPAVEPRRTRGAEGGDEAQDERPNFKHRQS
jgi:hypothetical protein